MKKSKKPLKPVTTPAPAETPKLDVLTQTYMNVVDVLNKAGITKMEMIGCLRLAETAVLDSIYKRATLATEDKKSQEPSK